MIFSFRLRAVLRFVAISCVLPFGGAAVNCYADDAASLTKIEMKWLEAADPVLQYAVEQGLPIDVVVHPDNSGEVPFSVGVLNERCKLTLAMRDRSDVETLLVDVPVAQHALLIEAMTAHEVAHCWRYKRGQWQVFPPTANESLSFASNDRSAQQRRAMRSTQSEEAFADLVALAWTQLHHPAEYNRVYAWLAHVREEQPVDGSFHDTRAWIALAKDPAVFAATLTPFEQVHGLWVDGLTATADPFDK